MWLNYSNMKTLSGSFFCISYLDKAVTEMAKIYTFGACYFDE